VPENTSDGKQVTPDAWRQQRIARETPGKNIELKLSKFQVQFTQQNKQSVVSFDQEYQSKNYKDISRKELIFTSRGDQWYIIGEQTKIQ
jgi:uncharacterized protein YchJ